MDMVRSMRSNSSLSHFLWTEALNMTMYILNRVPTKVVQKTPFGNPVCDIYAYGDARLK